MTAETTNTAIADRAAAEIRDGFLRRRSGLVMPALLLLVGLGLIWGNLTMQVPSTALPPGPQVVPWIVAVASLVMAVLLAIDVIRRPEPAAVSRPEAQAREAAPTTTAVHMPGDVAEPETRPRSNRRALLGSIATAGIFIAAIVPVGWLLSAAFLFWGMARSLGSRRTVFDIFLALSISAIVQLAFSAGLGLSLPPGILAGAL